MLLIGPNGILGRLSTPTNVKRERASSPLPRKFLLPVCLRVLLQSILDDPNEFYAVFNACLVARETRISYERWLLENLLRKQRELVRLSSIQCVALPRPRFTHLLVIPRTDDEKSVLAREYLVRHNGRVCCPVPGSLLSSDQVIGCNIRKPCQLPKHAL